MIDALMQIALTVSGALFDSLWEGALIVGLLWLGLRFLPQLGAASRYALWLCGLMALVLMPTITVLFPPPQHLQPVQSALATNQAIVTRQGNQIHPATVPVLPVDARTVDMLAPAMASTPQITISQSVALAVALLWILIVCLRATLLGFNLIELASLRRDAWLWSSSHDYPVLLSNRVTVPLAVGFLNPAVILPAALVEEETIAAVDAIVMHETAHLRRKDVWTNAVARVLEALVALNPLAWFVLQRLATEREIACDDWVVARLGAGDVFARALAAMASCSGPRVPLGAPSAIGSRHSIVTRIERLLDARPRRLRLSLSALGGTLMLFALVTIVLQSISPVLALAPQSPASIQVASGCVTPNRGIRALMETDRTNSVERTWVAADDPRKYAQQLGAAHIASVDLTVNAAGIPSKVLMVSAPAGSSVSVIEKIARSFTSGTYEPALRNCVAVTSTQRVGVYVGTHGGSREQTLSMVTPSYPAGWSAAHPAACKVPNLLHTGVPAFPASLRNMSVTTTYRTSVRLHVDSTGSVTSANLLKPSGSASLDDAVLSTARAQKFPLAESSGFKPVRPSHTSLAWNRAHGWEVYSKCDPLPADYEWTTTATRDDSVMVFPLWARESQP